MILAARCGFSLIACEMSLTLSAGGRPTRRGGMSLSCVHRIYTILLFTALHELDVASCREYARAAVGVLGVAHQVLA